MATTQVTSNVIKDGAITSAKLDTNIDISGVATASTFEPDGDTAAGDNAAIGYTAAEGLILTGQGSSTDVTVKNDADATVLSIATGTTQATFAGEVVAASLDISGDIDVDGTSNLDDVAIVGTATVTGTLQVKNGATSAGKIEFFEDSDNGTNKVTLIGPASTADITLTLPSSDGDSGQAMITDGSGNLSFTTLGGAYNDWSVKTTTYTAVNKDQLIANHASTAFTITLPSSPSAGNTVIIANAGAAVVTIGRNSSNINSVAADGTLLQGNSTQLVYVDGTIGWFQV
tara:strand:+ start:193 stop:1053 length:861 start_codon:yes stop_codon:yes gene_type:complete